MTGGVELLQECEAAGVLLLVGGEGELIIDAPPAALTPGLLSQLKTSKAELLDVLRTRNAEPRPSVSSSESVDITQFDFPREPPLNPPWCRYASHREGWRSIYGAVICTTCHPPATAKVVAERLTFASTD